jgi:hypothetical protein
VHVYFCDICRAEFATEEQRDLHRREVHLSAVPLLLLGSLAAPYEIRIRNHKTAEQIGFQNCRMFFDYLKDAGHYPPVPEAVCARSI